MRTPFAVMAVLVVALYGSWLATERGRSDRASGPRAASVDEIARRVEALRDLRFSQLPEPLTVSPRQAAAEGLEDLDRNYPEARRRADEEIYKLLGLIEPEADLRELS